MSETKIEQTGESVFVARTVLTPREKISPGLIRVHGGRFVSVERLRERVSGATELDGAVVPGLVDLQVNGWRGTDLLEGTVHAVERIAIGLVEQGVTAWLPTLVSSDAPTRLAAIDAVAKARERQRKGTVVGARILGVHLEGPWISRARAGAHDTAALEAPNPLSIEQSLGRQPGLVRMVTLASELPGGIEGVRQIVASGAVASLGHTDASYDEASMAIDAGARMATHLYNAMRPSHHRDPGVAGAVLTDARVVASVIADGVHVHPATVALVFRAKPERVALVSDVVSAEAADPSSGAARLEDGTLAGSLRPLWEGIAVAARAGIMVEDAVQAATLTPAETLHVRIGRLEPRAPADFVVLDTELRPRATYLGGRRVWSA